MDRVEFATPSVKLKTKPNGGERLLGPWRPKGHHDYGIGAGGAKR